MFITLLLVTFLISFAVCFIVAWIFRAPVNRILQRLLGEDIFREWSRYLSFALYVVGLSGGVRVWDLERYITATAPTETILDLTPERWVLELYRTIIGTLQSVAWMLLVFFMVSLLAFIIVKGREIRRTAKDEATT